MLDMRTEENVQWVMNWMHCIHQILCTSISMCIPMIGPNGVSAYTPARVLRQIGILQIQPHESDLKDFITIQPEREVFPKRTKVLKAWKSLKTNRFKRIS